MCNTIGPVWVYYCLQQDKNYFFFFFLLTGVIGVILAVLILLLLCLSAAFILYFKSDLCSVMSKPKANAKILMRGENRNVTWRADRCFIYLFLSLDLNHLSLLSSSPQMWHWGIPPLSTLPWWRANTITDILPEGLWIWAVRVRGLRANNYGNCHSPIICLCL